MCTSGRDEDLALTDSIAAEIITKLKADAPPRVKAQYEDNLLWVQQAGANKLVVGSKARILYNGAQVLIMRIREMSLE